MFWKKKEVKEGLPELPEPSNIRPMLFDGFKKDNNVSKTGEAEKEAEGSAELPELPEFPEFEDKEEENGGIKLVEPVIKPGKIRAVEMKPSMKLPMLVEEAVERGKEMKEKKEIRPSQGFTEDYFKPLKPSIASIPRARGKNEDIFVKIDKFHSAKKTLSAIESKIEEIDDMLKRIRETKMREEQELNAWEKEIQDVKARIKEVTESIFEKVD